MSETQINIEINEEKDIVLARQTARNQAQKIGFGSVDQSRITTAVSELARNVLRYATDGKGRVYIKELIVDGGPEGLEVIVQDDGPGIENPEKALEAGFSSGRGMGLGLPGTKRLMDEMILESLPGKGTTVTIRKWKHS